MMELRPVAAGVLRGLNALCVVGGLVLAAVGPWLCTPRRCCQNCYLSLDGGFWMRTKAGGSKEVRLGASELWGVLLAWCLSLASLGAALGLLGASVVGGVEGESRRRLSLLVTPLCCFGAASAVTGAALLLSWALLGYHGLGAITMHGWIAGATFLLSSAGLFLLDLVFALILAHQEKEAAQEEPLLFPLHHSLLPPPPAPPHSAPSPTS